MSCVRVAREEMGALYSATGRGGGLRMSWPHQSWLALSRFLVLSGTVTFPGATKPHKDVEETVA